MSFKRLTPVLLLKDGLLVRSQLFRFHQCIGDPIPTLKRLADWNVDEIILLNIGGASLDSRRDDKWHNLGSNDLPALVEQVSRFCFSPLTVGGGLETLEQVDELFESGADKCLFNSSLFSNPDLVREVVSRYGAQAVVASIDVKRENHDRLAVFSNRGSSSVGMSLREAIDYVKGLGIGEILLSSIDYDGSGNGYDPLLLLELRGLKAEIPLVINSGARLPSHFVDGFVDSSVTAVAASNVFYFTELSYPIIKDRVIEMGISMRPPDLSRREYISREPSYKTEDKLRLLVKASPGEIVSKDKYRGELQKSPQFCTRCWYSSQSATPMQFSAKGLCMGCITSDAKLKLTALDYSTRKRQLLDLVRSTGSSSEYDCIVSVSGGKDSYYQVHYVIHELGLNPLLVTYNGNNYSEVGWRNLMRMKDVFNCDHIIVSPSVATLKKLNYLAFVAMGDMNWHAHVGIFTTAPRVAVEKKIPLVFWGEHGYADLCGQFAMQDFPEMNYRERTEHAGRGFEWSFFSGLDGILDQHMNPWKYPSDKDLYNLKLRQIYLGHYIPWESNSHLKLVVEKYGFEVSTTPFERTYRTGSNLDDIHENGIHDYLKYIKFGYGRCTDHASKDIRAGLLTRDQGLRLIQEMDHIKPSDLQRWLEYVGISEEDFDNIADHFRDPRVWRWDEVNGWTKQQVSTSE